MVVGGRGVAHHNKNLRETMNRMAELGLKINVKKAKVGLKKVQYLGFTLNQSSYSLEEYIQKQRVNVPSITTRKESQNIIGVLNVCRSVCPGFNTWIQELYSLPKSASPNVMQHAINQVWEKFLWYNQRLKRG